MLAFSEFARLAQQGNYVPVTLTLTADLETPVSILSRLKDDENVFLLESVEAGERSAAIPSLASIPERGSRSKTAEPLWRTPTDAGSFLKPLQRGRLHGPEVAYGRPSSRGAHGSPALRAVLSVRSAGRCAVNSNQNRLQASWAYRQPSWWPKI